MNQLQQEVKGVNNEQYRKACRYRMQETLENLMGVWQVPDEQVDGRLIGNSLEWVERMSADLRYFQEKIEGMRQ